MTPAVDRERAERHLELADKHIAAAQQRIEAQLVLLARLERDGHDRVQARTLLELFENTLALQVEIRERIVKGIVAE